MNVNYGIKKGGKLRNLIRFLSFPYCQAIAIVLLYVAITVFVSIFLLHDSYGSHAFDLGLFSQSLKSTLEGHLLYHTMGGLSHLAYHFSPVLLLAAPFYWLFPHVETLLVIQAILFGSGGFLIYLLCRVYGLSHRTGLRVEILFLLNPLLWGAALFDFHEIAFMVPALLVLFLGLKLHNWWLIITGLVVALMTKEDVIIAVIAFGIVMTAYNIWRKEKVAPYPLIIIIGVLAYGLAVGISAISSEGYFPRILTYGSVRFEYLSLPIQEAAKGAINTFFSFDSLFLFCAFLAPLAFAPLIAWRWSFAGLLVLLGNMLSTCPSQHGHLFQSATPALPFLFMGFICSIVWIKDKPQIMKLGSNFNGRFFSYAFIILSIVSLVFSSSDRVREAKWPDAHHEAINRVLALVPDGVSVTANNTIFPHICTRTDAYLPRYIDPYTPIEEGDWGFPDKVTEYVLVDSKYKQDYIGGYWEDAVQGKLKEKYRLIADIDGAQLYQLRQPDTISSR